MTKGIRISEKHGVNPMIPTCFFCGKDKNEIVLLGRLPNDKEAPMHGVINKEPCDECKSFMEQGVILVSVKDGTDRDNPYRTGGFVVITEDAAERIFGDYIGKNRFAFVEDEAWDKLGLPRD
jgi:hypothetical protein